MYTKPKKNCQEKNSREKSQQEAEKNMQKYFGMFKNLINPEGKPAEVFQAMACAPDDSISCQYLHFAQTEDIRLKSISGGNNGESCLHRKPLNFHLLFSFFLF